MVMAADLLEELGMEIDPESLRLFLGDIIGKFNSSNANYILDFRKKHAHIWKKIKNWVRITTETKDAGIEEFLLSFNKIRIIRIIY